MKNYKTDNDYILNVLEEAEDNLVKELQNNIPKELLFTFFKFLAVRNEIEKIYIRNTVNKKII
ncbi:hypothetical protein FDB52_10245 [Clostridium botulinum]|uniref:hypothetical protein n=1 Tax=Clostridium botulinum TaxID=1491 RepID=UPI000773D0C3|nr:hypothetical protein [Clostridium botulinum]MBN1042186.1 hypothetical protein [Clostridium botulinum]NFE93728.1 hypothetical protein [Clostridium botulinum]NFL38960.1 hypothetical protein [Clostridium botulinum]NFL65637.1 hypothetical protein [Clostridium botulinum]NFN08691.1 hypothetical protein [Clostridium botulinum]